MDYPIFTYPKKFKEICGKYPELPEPPKKPVKPENPDSIPIRNNVGFSIILFAGFVTGIFLVFGEDTVFVGLVLIIIFALSPWHLYTSIIDYEKQRGIRNQRIAEFAGKLQHYFEKLKLYKVKKNEYDRKYEQLKSIESLRDYRLKIWSETEFNLAPEQDNTKINNSVSQYYFFDKLKERFGEKIIKNCFLPIKEKKYYLDFAFVDYELKFFLNIEIGKIYRFKYRINKYMEDAEQRVVNFLAESGWFTIKFSEEQIFKYPEECCNVIQSIINSFKEFTIYYDRSREIVDGWRKYDFIEMRTNRYRKTYLPINLISFIEQENYDFNEEVLLLFSETDYIEDTEKNDLPF